MSAEIVDFITARAQRVRRTEALASMAHPSAQQSFSARLSHSAQPLSLAQPLASQPAPRPAGDAALAMATSGPAFQFWTGVSGARYVHSVYNLFECPPFEAANYVLVKRHEGGQRTVVSIGRAANNAPSLNLAEVRQRASQLGANEVHIHLLAHGQDDSVRIEADLRGSIVLA